MRKFSIVCVCACEIRWRDRPEKRDFLCGVLFAQAIPSIICLALQFMASYVYEQNILNLLVGKRNSFGSLRKFPELILSREAPHSTELKMLF